MPGGSATSSRRSATKFIGERQEFQRAALGSQAKKLAKILSNAPLDDGDLAQLLMGMCSKIHLPTKQVIVLRSILQKCLQEVTISNNTAADEAEAAARAMQHAVDHLQESNQNGDQPRIKETSHHGAVQATKSSFTSSTSLVASKGNASLAAAVTPQLTKAASQWVSDTEAPTVPKSAPTADVIVCKQANLDCLWRFILECAQLEMSARRCKLTVQGSSTTPPRNEPKYQVFALSGTVCLPTGTTATAVNKSNADEHVAARIQREFGKLFRGATALTGGPTYATADDAATVAATRVYVTSLDAFGSALPLIWIQWHATEPGRRLGKAREWHVTTVVPQEGNAVAVAGTSAVRMRNLVLAALESALVVIPPTLQATSAPNTKVPDFSKPLTLPSEVSCHDPINLLRVAHTAIHENAVGVLRTMAKKDAALSPADALKRASTASLMILDSSSENDTRKKSKK